MTDIVSDKSNRKNVQEQLSSDNSLQSLFTEFEDRYRRESSDVRNLSLQMQELVATTEVILDDLEPASLWTRFWKRITGHTRRATFQNYRNQLKLQHSNILLVAAIARQNRMVMEGLRLTLEKLHNVEKDAKFLKETVLKVEKRRAARIRPFAKSWNWLKNIFTGRKKPMR
ncbi:MAG: hypothetical protein DRI44_09525 [Chlamydiae bacterium]|nr:MAG: hypothetical protein DRI44_09525 [Chlamydiota bacterium]